MSYMKTITKWRNADWWRNRWDSPNHNRMARNILVNISASENATYTNDHRNAAKDLLIILNTEEHERKNPSEAPKGHPVEGTVNTVASVTEAPKESEAPKEEAPKETNESAANNSTAATSTPA